MKVLSKSIAAITPRLVQIRQQIHQRPELSNHEAETAQTVTDYLTALGSIEVQTGVGGHGVIGTLCGAAPGKTLALRADMDALPIQEANAIAYQSQNSGVMHACGHDGHTAILLGVADILSARKEELTGEVRFIFQPAEEAGEGAKRMMAEGALNGANAIAALHAWPPLPVGQVGIRSGAMTASADTIEITVTGRGAHAAYPHLGADPIVAAAQVILALQTLPSREIDPTEPVVVSITQIAAGTASNIIPDVVRMTGTLRAHSYAVRAALPEQIRRVCEGICSAHRCQCEIKVSDGNPPVVNDPAMAELLVKAAGEALGAENVIVLPSASMGAEDFAEYLMEVPGVFFRLGIGVPIPLHSSHFNFSDEAIPVGVHVLSEFALLFLDSARTSN